MGPVCSADAAKICGGEALRLCSKPGCGGRAIGTLTYDYQNSTVVLGPLATVAEPHSYDLCEPHLSHLTVPKGWDVVRLDINYEDVAPSDDDLMALVEAVREAAAGDGQPPASSLDTDPAGAFPVLGKNRAHFQIVDGEGQVSAQRPTGPSQEPEHGPF